MTFSFCLGLLLFTGLSAYAQQAGFPTSDPTATPAPKAKPAPTATPRTARPVTPRPPVIYTPGVTMTYPPYPTGKPQPTPKKKIRNPSAGPAEKMIAVDSKVSLSLCATSGDIKVNGWNRDEVRAYVDGGSDVGFRVKYDRNKKIGAAQILGYDPKEHSGLDIEECLDGRSIELDVPMDAALIIKSKSGDITIDSIGKIRIDNLSGTVNLRNISQNVEATNFEGDITLEESNGPVNLFASTGRIMVIGAQPIEMGDHFSAKTRSGSISLQDVGHNAMNVTSATGSVRFTGSLESGGQYAFNTTSGKLEFNLPSNTSCKLVATYGGSFDLLIPVKDVINNQQPGVKKVIALLGTGESTLTVTTFSGSILIKPTKK